MNVLVDSHALVWAAVGDARLSPRARAALEAERLWLSSVTHWELAIKAQRRRLPITSSVTHLIEQQVSEHGIELLAVTFEHGAEFELLPAYHRDPFDRMLIAQARVEGLAILTADRAFRRYDIEVIW